MNTFTERFFHVLLIIVSNNFAENKNVYKPFDIVSTDPIPQVASDGKVNILYLHWYMLKQVQPVE